MFKSVGTAMFGMLAAAVVPSAAHAALFVDVRLADGSKSAVVAPGDTFTINLYATVTGTDGNLTNEGFQSMFGSLLSSNGGLPVNFTSAVAVAPFDSTSRQDTTSTTLAALVDLDGDGDLDVGSNNNASAAGFVRPAASTLQPGSSEFWLLTATVSVPLDAGLGLSTDLNWRFRTPANGIFGTWLVDGVAKAGGPGITPATLSDVLTLGSPVTVSTAVPEPATLGVAAMAGAGLLARRRRVGSC